jgi:homogentisate 1,2-dioxygenase
MLGDKTLEGAHGAASTPGGLAGLSPTYQSGFGNDLSSEAVPDALPVGRSSPQVPAHGLVHELISGTTFTAPRASNRRVHLYRIRPSTSQRELRPTVHRSMMSGPFPSPPTPNQIRWSPFEVPGAAQDFVSGITTLCGNGSVTEQSGMALHVYLANQSMGSRVFSDADGELLVIPQQGELRFVTELGILDAGPGEIVIIPRGCKFRADLLGSSARGFICENYGIPFQLPELGLIGATGQANAWDFEIPEAAYEDLDVPVELVHKYAGGFWTTELDHSPFDVVGWRGNYAPARFNMHRFNIMGTAAFDHPDPSIFCALSSPSDGVAGPNADFMIIPPRWQVAEDTFRPPGYHRNCVSEILGLIEGRYDGKSAAFRPGSVSLHNAWAPHGPDTATYDAGLTGPQTPVKLDHTLAFMIETRYPMSLTDAGLNCPQRERDYIDGWSGFTKRFR